MDIKKIRSLYHYDPETGHLTRRKGRSGHFAGSRAGFDNGGGYRAIRANGKAYLEHRLIWALVYGSLPDGQIDHINLDKSDNRIANLRLADSSQQQANTAPLSKKNGIPKGVRPCGSKWQARIGIGGKTKHLGVFHTKESASDAYAAALKNEFGEFARA